jgi:hypothetical protein
MLTLCNTSRGRLACGLGGVLIAVLALACLWCLSPAVAAGDDVPAKAKDTKKDTKAPCRDDLPPKERGEGPYSDLPPLVPPGTFNAEKPRSPAPTLSDLSSEDQTKEVRIPPTAGSAKKGETEVGPLPPVGQRPATTAKPDYSGSIPVRVMPEAPAASSNKAPAPLPPTADTPPVPGASGVVPAAGTGVGAAIGAGAGASLTPPPSPPPAPQSTADVQEIKQLVAQLSEIRADRAKLDEKERQTIQNIRRKYQEQKQALEQLERQLAQLGINCNETPAPPTRAPIDSPVPSLGTR